MYERLSYPSSASYERSQGPNLRHCFTVCGREGCSAEGLRARIGDDRTQCAHTKDLFPRLCFFHIRHILQMVTHKTPRSNEILSNPSCHHPSATTAGRQFRRYSNCHTLRLSTYKTERILSRAKRRSVADLSAPNTPSLLMWRRVKSEYTYEAPYVHCRLCLRGAR